MADTEEPPTQAKLTELTNAANLEYSLRHYNDAAELYSRATEMQTALRGDEMAPENAELLYLYGRCLFKVAVSKSDVLGGQVAAEKKKAAPPVAAAKTSETATASPGQKLAEDVVEAVVEEKDGAEDKGAKSANQPFFQLVDAEWSDEEGEDDDADADAEAQEAIEEEDDFATAYEILDVARVLLERQVQAQEVTEQQDGDSKGKGKAADAQLSQRMRQIKERLAETHDLQAEISLENERFDEAITDFTSAASLKDELYPRASSIVAEAHYKLSLALEFESMSAVREAQAKEGESNLVPASEKPEVNEELREKARKETEIALDSIKLRIAEEETKLKELEGEAEKSKTREIEDVKEILKEMEDRLKELHAPAVTMQAPTAASDDNPMAGILGQVLGESKAEQKARIEEATKNANDLSGLVKKKKPKQSNGTSAGTPSANGKRKLEEPEVGGEGKRAKTEEMPDLA